MDHQACDKVLFDRLKTGDRLALNSLFTEYYQRLCAFALSYVRNREESEEIVADVFLNIWNNRDQINIYSSVRSYFFAATRNACVARISKARLPLVDLNDDHDDLLVNADQGPHEQLEFTDFKQLVQNSVDGLPPACRRIFVMSRFEGLRYKEISEILGISEKTVENQIIKALGILRERLRPTVSQESRSGQSA